MTTKDEALRAENERLRMELEAANASLAVATAQMQRLDPEYFSQRMRFAMAYRGTNAASLAKAVGVSNVSIHNWLKGVRTPSREHLRRLCEALRCPIEWIVRPEPFVYDYSVPTTMEASDA